MSLPPTIYEILSIGAGQLSVMAKPVSGEWIKDEFAGLRRLGVDHVVSLLEKSEQIEVGLGDEENLCSIFDMRYTSFPIIDRELPRTAQAMAMVASLHRDISGGEHVVVHCRAGIGRTGLMASAILIRDGFSPAEAIHMVSIARGVLVPDTDEQDAWIRALPTNKMSRT